MNASIKLLLPIVAIALAFPAVSFAQSNDAALLVAIGPQGIASAPDRETRWVAELSAGPQRDCSSGIQDPRWSIVEKDGDFVAVSESGTQWHVSTRNLNADRSGRVEGTDGKGKPFWFEFEPGHGPRKILFNGFYRACVWCVTPR